MLASTYSVQYNIINIVLLFTYKTVWSPLLLSTYCIKCNVVHVYLMSVPVFHRFSVKEGHLCVVAMSY